LCLLFLLPTTDNMEWQYAMEEKGALKLDLE